MTPVKAPDGAYAWSPVGGWLHDEREALRALERDGWTLLVDGDGLVHVDDAEAALLHVVLRIDADLVALTARLDELEARSSDAVVAKLVELTGNADHAARLDEIARRVDALEDRTSGLDTDRSVELFALKRRVAALERGPR